MGWTGQESHISLGIFFRTMYCSKCAAKLKKCRLTRTIRKGGLEFNSAVLNNRTVGMDAKQKVSYVYRCPKCGQETSYEDQILISKQQKKLGKKILK